MLSLDKFRYTANLKYMKTDTKKYVTIESYNIEYIVIDRDYDNCNMPTIYMGLNIDKNLADHMILNEKTNVINLEIYKFRYDDQEFIPRLEEVCVRAQCTYFMTDDINPDKEIDYADTTDGIRTDIYKRINLGLMKIQPININKQVCNKTFTQTTLLNGVRTILNHVEDILMEPLSYADDILNEISVFKDSVSKSLEALNGIKVFYSTPYRFFIDFNLTYLLSSKGLEVPRRGESIAAVLICIKETKDTIGMDDGMYINRSQGNYQINIVSSSTALSTDKLTEKVYNNLVAITNSGEKTSIELNLDKSSYGSSKTKTIYIPNDNVHMIDNIKAQVENGGTSLTICKECLDCDALTPNHRIIVKNLPEHADKNGDYLISRKREIYVRDGKDFVMSTMANLRRIR